MSNVVLTSAHVHTIRDLLSLYVQSRAGKYNALQQQHALVHTISDLLSLNVQSRAGGYSPVEYNALLQQHAETLIEQLKDGLDITIDQARILFDVLSHLIYHNIYTETIVVRVETILRHLENTFVSKVIPPRPCFHDIAAKDILNVIQSNLLPDIWRIVSQYAATAADRTLGKIQYVSMLYEVQSASRIPFRVLGTNQTQLTANLREQLKLVRSRCCLENPPKVPWAYGFCRENPKVPLAYGFRIDDNHVVSHAGIYIDHDEDGQFDHGENGQFAFTTELDQPMMMIPYSRHDQTVVPNSNGCLFKTQLTEHMPVVSIHHSDNNRKNIVSLGRHGTEACHNDAKTPTLLVILFYELFNGQYDLRLWYSTLPFQRSDERSEDGGFYYYDTASSEFLANCKPGAVCLSITPHSCRLIGFVDRLIITTAGPFPFARIIPLDYNSL